MARLGVYREGGMKAVVEIVADNSDDDWERYELRVIRILAESTYLKPPTVGRQFSVDGTKGEGSAYKGWHLNEDDPELHAPPGPN